MFLSMLKNFGQGAAKVEIFGLKYILAEGSVEPNTALGSLDSSSDSGNPTIASQAVQKGTITLYGVMVSKFANPWRPAMISV